jgi:hypothetical protein
VSLAVIPAAAQDGSRGEARTPRIVWPGQDRPTASPESQGLSATALGAAAAYAERNEEVPAVDRVA